MFNLAIGVFLSRYWRVLVGAGLVILVIGGSYWKGRIDVLRKVEIKQHEEIQRRYKTFERTRERTEKKKEEIREDRKSTPSDDKRDSCLLSNDPYSTDCVGH